MNKRAEKNKLPDTLGPEYILVPELPGKRNTRRRIALGVLMLIAAAIGIAALLNVLYSRDPGWRRIPLRSGSMAQAYEQQLVFHYNLGESDVPATTEYRRLQSLYTKALSDAKSLYNLKRINSSPNKEIKVSKELYAALKKLVDSGDRRIFLGPVYELYSSVFQALNDRDAARNDPYLNEDAYAYLQSVMKFVSSASDINILFAYDNKITLAVSDEYLEFAKDNGITTYIDFFWMENVFMVDYIADTMIANNYTLGKVASYDGFSRDLDIKEGYAQVIIRRIPDRKVDISHYYAYADGSVRHAYIDATNGLCCDIPKDFGIHQDGYTCECFDSLLGMLPQLVYNPYGSDGLLQ